MNQRIIKVDTAETTSLIFGTYDVNLRIIEERFPVTLRNKSGEDGTDAILISGESMDAVNGAAAVVEYLRDMVRHTTEITDQSVRYVVDMIETTFVEFPVFNVADCFITCGAIAMIAHLVFCNKEFRKDGKK